MRSRITEYSVVALCLVQLVLVPLSWLLSVADVGFEVRSLISSEGIRWFFGRFASMLASPFLVCLLLLSMAYGCIKACGLPGLFVRRPLLLRYRERVALLFGGLSLLLLSCGYSMLVFVPHAVLRGVTGDLLPSPFSASVVPSVAFIIIVVGMVYGAVSGCFHRVSDVCHSLFSGVSFAAPLFLYYILLMQLYHSIVFVFG